MGCLMPVTLWCSTHSQEPQAPTVTPRLGPLSCQDPCPRAVHISQPCGHTGKSSSEAKGTDSAGELRAHRPPGLAHSPGSNKVREGGEAGSAGVTGTPARTSPCRAGCDSRKGEVAGHQLPLHTDLWAQPNVQSLPGTKAVGAFIIGNYSGRSELARPPVHPLSPAKWTLWQPGRGGGEHCAGRRGR